MATVHQFEELGIWQLAFTVYRKIGAITEKLRAKHEYRFAEQMKSAAGSVMDNIAEGFERNSRLEFLNSLSIAKGECGELKSQCHRCLADKYITQSEFDELYQEIDVVIKKIAAFIIYLNKSTVNGLKFKDRSKN